MIYCMRDSNSFALRLLDLTKNYFHYRTRSKSLELMDIRIVQIAPVIITFSYETFIKFEIHFKRITKLNLSNKSH